jgi:uncharacterized protein (DUF1786 family)
MQENPKSILALDVGSGTQDVLLWLPGEAMENCVQMVLPSPTALLARRVREATSEGRPIHLKGFLMGGGPVAWAVRDHASAGLPVTAEPAAALTLHDDPAHVQKMGVVIQARPGDGAAEIHMGDIQRAELEGILRRFGMDPPESWCVAVQDHGHRPHGSNREFRFSHWRGFLESGGAMAGAVYSDPPSYLTRMRSVLMQVPGAMVMDTGMAAILGAGCDPWVRSRLDRGVVVVNLGNQHALAALITRDTVWGLLEHHTGALHREALARWVEAFRRGQVRHEEVLADGGHGCAYHPAGIPGLPFDTVAVTGPRRSMTEGLGWTMASPFGNMMLTGCYGLIRAFHLVKGMDWPRGGA